MTLDTAIARFRSRQKALFRDECEITRASEEEPTFNEATGEYETPNPTEVYEGPCLLRPAGGLVGTDVIAGEREVRLSDYVLKLPANTPVRSNDSVSLTVSTYDDDLVGRSYRITDVLRDGWQIARKCVVEEVS